MVTAEVAVVLPAIVLVLAFVVAAGSVVVDQIRLVDAARAAARAAARGDAIERVVQLATLGGPPGTRVTVDGGDLTTVVVTAPPPPLLRMAGVSNLRASATTTREWGGP